MERCGALEFLLRLRRRRNGRNMRSAALSRHLNYFYYSQTAPVYLTFRLFYLPRPGQPSGSLMRAERQEQWWYFAYNHSQFVLDVCYCCSATLLLSLSTYSTTRRGEASPTVVARRLSTRPRGTFVRLWCDVNEGVYYPECSCCCRRR